VSGRSLVALVLAAASPAMAQIPDRFTNLKVLPPGISRDSLVNIMRGFSLQLGVRCQYCHVGGDGVSFAGVNFASDDDIHKQRARFMLRMVDSLNRVVLPSMPGADASLLRMECKTCHRGGAKPYLLTQELEHVRDSAGMPAAIARYRALRESSAMSGRYDFGEWEMNLWGERLAASGRTADATAVLELNLEFFPRSTGILTTLARIHEPIDRAKAIGFLTRALAIRPNADIQKRVDSLRAVRP
jgi:hypothetical protein